MHDWAEAVFGRSASPGSGCGGLVSPMLNHFDRLKGGLYLCVGAEKRRDTGQESILSEDCDIS